MAPSDYISHVSTVVAAESFALTGCIKFHLCNPPRWRGWISAGPCKVTQTLPWLHRKSTVYNSFSYQKRWYLACWLVSKRICILELGTLEMIGVLLSRIRIGEFRNGSLSFANTVVNQRWKASNNRKQECSMFMIWRFSPYQYCDSNTSPRISIIRVKSGRNDQRSTTVIPLETSWCSHKDPALQGSLTLHTWQFNQVVVAFSLDIKPNQHCG